MRLRITNNRPAPYGVEKASGGYVFIPPGEQRTVDVTNPGPLYGKPFLDVEDAGSEVPAPPENIAAIAAKVGADPFDHDGKDGPGGSRKGRASTAAKGARRRRRKTAKK